MLTQPPAHKHVTQHSPCDPQHVHTYRHAACKLEVRSAAVAVELAKVWQRLGSYKRDGPEQLGLMYAAVPRVGGLFAGLPVKRFEVATADDETGD